jgi:hypothetical protein
LHLPSEFPVSNIQSGTSAADKSIADVLPDYNGGRKLVLTDFGGDREIICTPIRRDSGGSF